MALKNYMKEHKIRTKDLAEKVSVTDSYISQIRHGLRRPSPDLAMKISDAIGINVLDLLYPKNEERQESASDKTAEVSV